MWAIFMDHLPQGVKFSITSHSLKVNENIALKLKYSVIISVGKGNCIYAMSFRYKKIINLSLERNAFQFHNSGLINSKNCSVV